MRSRREGLCGTSGFIVYELQNSRLAKGKKTNSLGRIAGDQKDKKLVHWIGWKIQRQTLE